MPAKTPNPYAPPREQAGEQPPDIEPDPPADGEPRGWNFWLVVSLLGVLLWGVLSGIGALRNSWVIPEVLAADAPASYLVQFGARLTMVSASCCISLVALVWMSRHDRRLPTLMLVFYGLQLMMMVYFIFATDPIGSEANDTDISDQTMGLAIWAARSIAWMLYFTRSRRVANTFVN